MEININEAIVRNAIQKYSKDGEWLKLSDIPNEDLIKEIKYKIPQSTFWRIIEKLVQNDELEVQYVENPKRNIKAKQFRLKKKGDN